MAIPGLGGYSGMWQFDGSSTYPNNMLGVINDIDIYNNGCTVDRLENLAANLSVSLPTMLAQYQAQMAQQWQAAMTNLTSSNRSALNGLNPAYNMPGLNFPGFNFPCFNNNGRIQEGKIIDTLKQMGSGIYVADRINQEIVVKDKDGNERTVTILNRLLELVDEYRKDPDNATLSKEDYEKIWDIASRYNQNGDISSEDFAALKKIALNASGSDSAHDDDDGDDDGDDDENQEVTPDPSRRSENYRAGHYDTATASSLAGLVSKAVYTSGTDCDDLQSAISQVTKYNVIEVIDAFKKEKGVEYNETIIDAILNDCCNWGTGRSHCWFTDDDAKEFIEPLADNLIARAKDVMKLDACNDAMKEVLTQKSTELQQLITSLNNNTSHTSNGDDLTASEKTDIKNKFDALIEAIRDVETQIYGEDS